MSDIPKKAADKLVENISPRLATIIVWTMIIGLFIACISIWLWIETTKVKT